MITIKSKPEIEILRQGGQKLAHILDMVIKKAKPGISTKKLDQYAEKLILKTGGRPSFKNFAGYPAVLCVSPNEAIVHGVPKKNIILKSGDVVGIDIGMWYPAQTGLCTDMARTIGIGKITNQAKKLIKVTERSFYKSAKIIKPGATIGDIGYAVQTYVESQGLSVIRSLSGHGVGYKVHEDPKIPNYGQPSQGEILKPGMILAIEPMVSVGDYNLETLSDGWTAVTKDKSLTAHYENTVAVTEEGCEVLTNNKS